MDEQLIELAIAALTTEIEKTPDNAMLYKERGRLRMMAGQKAEAMQDVQKALQLDPSLADALNGKFQN